MFTHHHARGPAIFVVAAAFATLSVGPASATTLRAGSATGPAIAAGASISGTLAGNAVIKPAPGYSYTCAGGSMSGIVGANPAPTVTLASASRSTGTSCTDPGFLFLRPFEFSSASTLSITSNAAGTGGTADWAATPLTVAFGRSANPSAPTATCQIVGGATTVGVFANSDPGLAGANALDVVVPFAGHGLGCSEIKPGSFLATYTNLKTATNQKVFVTP